MAPLQPPPALIMLLAPAFLLIIAPGRPSAGTARFSPPRRRHWCAAALSSTQQRPPPPSFSRQGGVSRPGFLFPSLRGLGCGEVSPLTSLAYSRPSHGRQWACSAGSSSVERRPSRMRSAVRRFSRCGGTSKHRLGASSNPLSDGDDVDDGAARPSEPSVLPSSSTGERPTWALPWMPTWLVAMRPAGQFVVGLLCYMFHLRVLTQNGLVFPVQLIPNDEGWFQGIGLDSLAGMAAFAGLVFLRRSSAKAVANTPAGAADGPSVAIPPLWADPTESEAPWRLRPAKSERRKRDASDSRPHARSTSIVAFVLLTGAYFSTGRFALFFENALYAAAGHGLPLTVAMHRSLVVLLGHLAWVVAGSAILAGVVSPKPFFGGGWAKEKGTGKKGVRKNGKEKVLQAFRWYTNKWDTYWLWWTVGGYFVSAWLFNIADFLNQIILPPAVFEFASEGVVSQLINPENNDIAASIVGYIAPCISAPWWEEVLYRGYLLPALNLFMGFWPSVFASGVLFSVHHLSTTGAIPLAVLGWTWAALYAKSGNLLVTILIHAMWNSRVFLGSWLGL